MGSQGPAGATGASGAAGPPGPQGPAGPPSSGAYGEDAWGFAGFTVTTYTGNIGGRVAAHNACDTEFPGAHFCHASEYVLSTPLTPVPPTGAWIDSSSTPDGSSTVSGAPSFGRMNSNSNSCTHWTAGTASTSSTYVASSGTVFTGTTCDVARSLACCNGAPKAVFAGFTAAGTSGNLGGRTAAHALCDAEYAGAHMCHAAEYVRSASPELVPAEGAWIDSSITLTGTSSVSGVPGYGRIISNSNSCTHWTAGTTSTSSTYVASSGAVFTGTACDVLRRVACCY